MKTNLRTIIGRNNHTRRDTITHDKIVECRRHKVPSEAQEGRWLMQWARFNGLPLVHVPNEGRRTWGAGKHLKEQGLAKGFPDYALWEMRKGYGALLIELKRTRGAHISYDQTIWLKRLNDKGYLAVVCYGWVNAKEQIESYLGE